MKLRRFNTGGVSAFANYRARLALEPGLPPPVELLEDPVFTEVLPGDVEVGPRSFATRMDAGIFLN